MQYVNDDMDELFRRAAEDYPLDTKSADWSKVVAALQGQAQEKTISEKKKNKNGRLLWLLLLLPLGLICNQLYSPGASNGKEVSTTDSDRNIVVDTKTSQKSTNTTNSSGINGGNSAVVTTDRTDFDKESKNKNQTIGSLEASVNTSKIFGSSKLSFSKRNSKNYPANNVTHTNTQTTNQEAETDTLIIDETGYSRKYVSKISSSPILYGDVVTSVNRELSPLFSSSEEKSKQPIRVAKRKRFYAGIVGGIDATTIKFQKIENAGMTYGALLGYQINKKWSIETGLYSERKYYYSDGKYFNTSKIYMPPNSEIDNVSGNCRMFELPVVLRRNFYSGKNSEWFAAVGGSTYFMKQQNYSYEIYYYNTGTSHTYNKLYKNSSNYFFSNLSISGGYIHRLGNFADLRIEPYLKLPVSGIGIGSLPMFSTGLQIGVTKKF